MLVVGLSLAATPSLEDARAAMQSLQCNEALELAAIAEKSPTLQPNELEEVWWIQARCAIALGDHKRSDRALQKLLQENPSFVPAAGDSPKVREVVERTREALYPKDFVKLEPIASSAARSLFRLIDPFRRVAKVELVTRTSLESAWKVTPLVRERLVIEEGTVAGRQWFIRGVDAKGAVVVSNGTEETPNGAAFVAVAPIAAVEVKPSAPGLKGGRVAGIVLMSVAAVCAGAAVGLRVDAENRYRRAIDEPFASDVRSGYRAAVEEQTVSSGLFIGGGVLIGLGAGLVIAF